MYFRAPSRYIDGGVRCLVKSVLNIRRDEKRLEIIKWILKALHTWYAYIVEIISQLCRLWMPMEGGH